MISRLAQGRKAQPSAVILDSRTLQSTLESGGRSVALLVTPANEQDHDQVQQLIQKVQEVTGETVAVAFVDEGYTLLL